MTEIIDKCFPAMGTICSVMIYGTENRVHAQQAKNYILELDKKWSVFRAESEISQLNRTSGKYDIPVSDDTQEILRQSIRYGYITGGAFDVTTGPLTEMWRQAAKKQRIPSSGKIRKMTEKVNFRKLHVNENRAFFDIPEGQVDLGGIAKGFALDRILKMLRKNGVEQAIVNLGGTIGIIGEPHMVGIQNPMAETGCCMGSVLLNNKCMVTSGSYERFHMIRKKKYHHIIDPRTGKPADTGICSVTLLGECACEMDALATAALILGPEKALPILTAHRMEAVFVMDNGDVRVTCGMQNSFRMTA